MRIRHWMLLLVMSLMFGMHSMECYKLEKELAAKDTEIVQMKQALVSAQDDLRAMEYKQMAQLYPKPKKPLLKPSKQYYGLKFAPIEVVDEETEGKFDLKDLRKPSGIEAADLEKHLAGTPLAGYGQTYVDAERLYGVNALFICAKDIEESGWGKRLSASNNLSGYRTSRGGWRRFNSLSECILEVSGALRYNYLEEPTADRKKGKYHTGVGIKDINVRYAVHSDGSVNWGWSERISKIMYQISQ